MLASVVTLVNNKQLYNDMVVSSLPPKLFELIPVFDAVSATRGLNGGIRKAQSDLIIMCHQDVSFPPEWPVTLEKQLSMLKAPIGVVGTFGRDLRLNCAGNIWNPYPCRRAAGQLPCKALTLDEHCLIIFKSSGLRFDESLTQFHFYGGDLCLTALESGLVNYVIDSELNHLSPTGTFDKSFEGARDWFIKKWRGKTKYKTFRMMPCEVSL